MMTPPSLTYSSADTMGPVSASTGQSSINFGNKGPGTGVIAAAVFAVLVGVYLMTRKG